MRSDNTSQKFATSFYNELIVKNFTVKKAFNNAVSNVNTTASTFLLLPEGENISLVQ